MAREDTIPNPFRKMRKVFNKRIGNLQITLHAGCNNKRMEVSIKMNKTRTILKQDSPRWGMGVFLLLFLAGMVYSVFSGERDYFYDSHYYWMIASPLTESGHFDLMLYPETFRGYFFPTLILLFKELHLNWAPLINCLVAATFAFSLPYLIQGELIHTRSRALRILPTYAVFLWVWGDFLQTPLSDVPAAAFMIAGAALVRSIIPCKSHVQIALRAFCAGVCLYAAYNTRVVFLYGIFILLIVLLVALRKDWKKLVMSLVCLAVGIGIIALPQSLINHQYTGSFAPKVYTEQLFNYSNNLQLQQLLWGMSTPRYETYAGALTAYPTAPVYFKDPIGEEIILREGINIGTISYGMLLKLAMKYPLDMIGLYCKHLLAGMTPAWRAGFITDIYTNKGLLVTISIGIWLVAALDILENIRKKQWSDAGWYCAAIALPCLLQMAGSVELRFLLPMYLLAYYYVFAAIDYRALWSGVKSKIISVLTVMLVIFVLWTSIIGSVLSMNTEKTLLIHDYSTVQEVE